MPDIGAFGDANSAAFLVRRGGGDYVRAGGDPALGPNAAKILRYEIHAPNALTEALFLSRPVGYDAVQVWWGVPPEGLTNWSYMCVVRSGFGHPSTPTDGEIVELFRRPGTGYSDDLVPGTFFDTGLSAGRWYYYTLFFRVGFRWYVAGTTESLVPIDYHHRDHLLGLVPPFYLSREIEDSNNFISRWMTMIGYDLDYTRSLTEGVQQIYDPDTAPQVLLDSSGQQNLGFTKQSKLGDIRYRSVLANNRTIRWQRGTINGLQTYVESVFKSAVTVTNGINELLLVDDAEFLSGVGNWSPMPWRIGYELAVGRYGINAGTTPAIPDLFKSRNVKIEAFVEHDEHDHDTPGSLPTISGPTSPWPLPDKLALTTGSPRGVARITAVAGEQLAVTCGAGQQSVIVGVDSKGQKLVYDTQHLDAFYRGIAIPVPVDPKDPMPTYYLSFWSRRVPGNTSDNDLIVYGFAQYDARQPTQGFSDGFRGVNATSLLDQPAPFPDLNPLNTLGGFDSWQARTSSDGPLQSPNYSFWPDSLATPILWNANAASAVLGTEFQTTKAGWITHIRYYRRASSPLPNTGIIWDSATQTQIASVTFTDPLAKAGWVVAKLPSPLRMEVGQIYTVSYYLPGGGFYSDNGGFPTPPATLNSGPLQALQARTSFGAVNAPPVWPATARTITYYADVIFAPQDPVPADPSTAPTDLPLLQTARLSRTGPGSDQWEHLVASFQISPKCRYLIPFIWYKLAAVDGRGVPMPVTTPRYVTGGLVNQSQGGGATQVFLPDEYLKMISEGTPSKHLIGGPGDDRPDRTQDTPAGAPYKTIGET